MHSPNLSIATIPSTPAVLTIDLRQAGTTRGGETPTVPPVALPRPVIAAHILLPYFSPGAKYVVSVAMDKDGSPANAKIMGTANMNGFHADLSVTLDLRSLPRRTYHLATTHERGHSVILSSLQQRALAPLAACRFLEIEDRVPL